MKNIATYILSSLNHYISGSDTTLGSFEFPLLFTHPELPFSSQPNRARGSAKVAKVLAFASFWHSVEIMGVVLGMVIMCFNFASIYCFLRACQSPFLLFFLPFNTAQSNYYANWVESTLWAPTESHPSCLHTTAASLFPVFRLQACPNAAPPPGVISSRPWQLFPSTSLNSGEYKKLDTS